MEDKDPIQKTLGLMRLQREYLVTALNQSDEALAIAEELESLEDPELIQAYLSRLDSLMNELDESERIATDIEKVLKKNCKCISSKV